MDELKANIHRLLKIGITIADLSKESKELRVKIADSVDNLNLGKVNEDNFVEFVIDNKILVGVKKVKDSKDYTVLGKVIHSV